jgi:hypothetical protein
MDVAFLCKRQCFSGAHPEFFIGGGGGGDPEAVYNLCLILKIVIKIVLQI